ncbi:MAG: 3'-5' exonuclease [Clostridia bacterium]|nr:3'-5' exonuclease [Clostridia bacterium]
MKLLFFDMEFANGQVKGSIYSIGYTVTDEDFQTIVPPTDILIDPDAAWNSYVEENILAYPKETVEAAPKFFEQYQAFKALFESVDVAVGFAVNNDIRALKSDCKRYGLEMPSFRIMDTERLCRMLDEHKDAHGLAGYVRAWCGEDPDNQHRSDGDALATMHLLRAICREKHVTPEMVMLAFPECCSTSLAGEKRPKKKGRTHQKGRGKGKAGKQDPAKTENLRKSSENKA